MKVRVKYNNALSEDEVIIQANENAENLPDIVQYIKQLSNRKTFTGKHNDEIHFIKQRDIICFRMENKILTIYTWNQHFTLNERLYTIKKQLSSNFLQISKSEIINIDYIDHLKLNKTGWFPLRISVIIVFILIYTMIYFVIWSIESRRAQRDINEINKIISENQKH